MEFKRSVSRRQQKDLRAFENERIEDLNLHLFYDVEPQLTIGEALRAFAAIAEDLHEQCLAALEALARTDRMVLHFDFPEEVRVPCEQYLLYFSEFLRDLGVEAVAELQHDAGHVLFSIIPKDREQALDKIREALAVYLRFPMAQGLDSFGVSAGDFRTQQLLANVQHLRGQLALASGMIQLKDATIQQQMLTIDQQRQMLSGQVLVEAVLAGPDGEKESLLGGAVAITKYEGPGFELNFAEMYRKAKKLFGKS